MYEYPSDLLEQMINMQYAIALIEIFHPNLCKNNEHINKVIDLGKQGRRLVGLYLTLNHGKVNAKEGV